MSKARGIANLLAEPGKITLKHFGQEKLITKETGIDVTGKLEADSLTINGITYEVVSALPVSPDNNTIYFVTG
jgi:hypothetical protein